MEQYNFDKRSREWWPPTRDLVFLHKLNPVRFDYFDRFMKNWAGVKVLDVGCGGGYTCEFLARREAVMTGTDISERSLEAAREHALQNGLRIEYKVCTVDRLPYPDNTFEAVTCFDMLEHVVDKEVTLSEIYRVLKPEGLLFFDTINKSFWSRLLVIRLGEAVSRSFEGGTHEWEYLIEPERLVALMQKTGLTDIRLAGVKFRIPSMLPRGLPFRIDPDGNTSVIYFGTAIKTA